MAGTLLRQVRVVDPASQMDQIQDVLITDGRFGAIAPTLDIDTEGMEVIDGTGQVLAPGLIDLYSHSGEPGNESRETLAALMAGAIAGGLYAGGHLTRYRPRFGQSRCPTPPGRYRR